MHTFAKTITSIHRSIEVRKKFKTSNANTIVNQQLRQSNLKHEINKSLNTKLKRRRNFGLDQTNNFIESYITSIRRTFMNHLVSDISYRIYRSGKQKLE